MGTQFVLSSAKRLFFNLCNALNPKPNSQTIRIFSPYRNISLFSLVFILKRQSLQLKVPLADSFSFFFVVANNILKIFSLSLSII